MLVDQDIEAISYWLLGWSIEEVDRHNYYHYTGDLPLRASWERGLYISKGWVLVLFSQDVLNHPSE